MGVQLESLLTPRMQTPNKADKLRGPARASAPCPSATKPISAASARGQGPRQSASSACSAAPRSLLIEDAEVRPPRSDRLRVPLAHNPSNLRDVVEVMHRPGRQQLPEGHRSKRWMPPRQRQLRRRQRQALDVGQVRRPQSPELRQQPPAERPAIAALNPTRSKTSKG